MLYNIGPVCIFAVGSYAHMCTPLPVVEDLDDIEQVVFGLVRKSISSFSNPYAYKIH